MENPKNDYEVIDVNSDELPDAVGVIKHTHAGKKFVATAHDGSKEAIRSIIRHKIELLGMVGYFSEVSGKIQDILLKNGVPVVDDKDTVERVLKGKEIELPLG